VEDKTERLAAKIMETQDCVSRAYDCLAREDIFGAALQLHRMRTILASISAELPQRRPEGTCDLDHEWRVVDPYVAQCRICGRQRPLDAVFYRLDPLLPLTAT